jgi:hypothetical protein
VIFLLAAFEIREQLFICVTLLNFYSFDSLQLLKSRFCLMFYMAVFAP